ncbi:MAG: divisome protein SepX/GlpR, partial [Nocardioides sp.]
MDDLSALIFVALAVAWAVYLIPKALQHHEDAVRSRSVDRFSHTMRVLARREPVNRRNARLVVSPGRTPSAPIVTTKHVTAPPQEQASPAPLTRAAATRATRRRRRVLGLVLVSLLTTVAVAAFGVISWWYVALPGAVLVAWLVACRLLVRQEQTREVDARLHEAATGEQPAVEVELPLDEAVDPLDPMDDTTSTPAITDPSLWDPMPVTLPTYVGKSVAQARSVRTIDLDSTGVWTSGRTEADA